MSYGVEEVNQRATHSVDRPAHDNIELAPLGIFEHLVQAGTLIAPLGPADTGIPIYLDDLPASRVRHLSELGDLIFNRLLVRGDAEVGNKRNVNQKRCSSCWR